jgi:hypothetical protein
MVWLNRNGFNPAPWVADQLECEDCGTAYGQAVFFRRIKIHECGSS